MPNLKEPKIIVPENWTFLATGTPAQVSQKLSSEIGTIEQNVRYGLQDIIDNAIEAVPPATSCTLTASQSTIKVDSGVARTINVAFYWSN